METPASSSIQLPAYVPPTTGVTELDLLTSVGQTPPLTYGTTACWEQYVAGKYQRSLLRRTVRLATTPAPNQVVSLHFTQPVLRQPESLQPLEQLGLQLAPLFGQLVLALDREGQVQEVLNYPQIQHTWAQLRASLLAAAAPEDQLTASLVAVLDKQISQQQQVRRALAHDYLYQTVLEAAIGRRPGAGAREFPHFFPRISLYFTQAKRLAPPALDCAQQVLRGEVDKEKTDMGAIEKCIRATLPDKLPTDPDSPLRLGYELEYEPLDDSADKLRQLTLRVYARLGSVYNKQYTLTLTHLS